MNTSLVNGKFSANVTILNRNFQYGEGVFETCALKGGKLLFWHKHYKRLSIGCAKLSIDNVEEATLIADMKKLVISSKIKNGIIKIILSTESFERGYSTTDAKVIRVVSISKSKFVNKIFFELSVCGSHYSNNEKLAGIKHCNRLENILASKKLDCDDCIMLDTRGNVISSTCANIFIVKDNELITPNLDSCGILGTRRSIVLEIASLLAIKTRVSNIVLADIHSADEVFITNSILGIQQISKLNNAPYSTKTYNTNKVTAKLKKAFAKQQDKHSITISSKITMADLLKSLVIIILILGLSYAYVNKNVKITKDKVIKVSVNDNLKQISKKLAKNGVIYSSSFFILLTKVFSAETKLQAGYYLVKGNSSVLELLQDIKSGNIIEHNVVLVAGKTVAEYYNELQKNPNVITEDSLAKELVKAGISYPYEGMLAPDTYRVKHKVNAYEILKKSFKKGQKTLNSMWQNRDKSIVITKPYQAIILASLIEKETALDAEKAKVSGVFYRRLRQNMFLQTDPSVIYALKNKLGAKYSGVLKKSDLTIDSLYNTYSHKGLPPTAISSVSTPSIYAALHPENSKNLYFVSKRDGSHAFSQTYDKHLKNISKYLIKN